MAFRPDLAGGPTVASEATGCMTTTGSESAVPVDKPRRLLSPRAVGVVLVLGLMTAAVAVPPLVGWNVHDGLARFPWTWRPPLHAHWAPRLGPGSVPALLVAVVGTAGGWRLAKRARWSVLVAAAWAVGLAWMVCLALVDGESGLGGALTSHSSYLPTAHHIGGIGAMLHGFVARIPLHSRDNWPIQVAGHPPGALLFFVGLVRSGVGTATGAGLVVAGIAATTPVAVLVTLRLLGAEHAARRVAPILVLSPAAIWSATSADAVFAAVAAWGIAALAAGAKSLPARRREVGGSARVGLAARWPAMNVSAVLWSAVAGLLLGCCLMLSYGLVLLAVLAVAVLVAGRSPYPLVVALPMVIAVVAGVALLGFSWWDAYPVLVDRYWAGLASKRPSAYWWWGDLAAFCFAAGPVVGAGVAQGAARLATMRTPLRVGDWRRVRSGWMALGADVKVPLLLTTGGLAAIALADASSMSKAEVERIWLPFLPWVLVCCALLPARWRRWGLVLQVGFAVAVQHLLQTTW